MHSLSNCLFLLSTMTSLVIRADIRNCCLVPTLSLSLSVLQFLSVFFYLAPYLSSHLSLSDFLSLHSSLSVSISSLSLYLRFLFYPFPSQYLQYFLKPSILHHLSSIIYPLSSMIYPLSSIIYPLSSILCSTFQPLSILTSIIVFGKFKSPNTNIPRLAYSPASPQFSTPNNLSQ